MILPVVGSHVVSNHVIIDNSSDSHNKNPEISGVILVDCWHDTKHRPEIQRFYKSVQYRLIALNPARTVNASYDLSLLATNHPWQLHDHDYSITNTLRNFAWDINTFSDRHLHNHWLEPYHRIVMNLVKHCNGSYHVAEEFLHPSILGNHGSVALFRADDFFDWWRFWLDQQIQDWLIVGRTWGICVHDRDLGLVQLQKLSQLTGHRLRFHVTNWSVLTEQKLLLTDQDIEQDKLTWIRTNAGWQLV